MSVITLALIATSLFLLLKFSTEKNRRISSAMEAMKGLTQACDAFFEEYQQLPLAHTQAIDSVKQTTGDQKTNIMPPLLGPRLPARESPKSMTFFAYKEPQDKKGGLLRNDAGTYAELFDPWGNPYHVLLNYDYNDELQSPHDGKIIKDRRVLIWSTGPDGKQGTPETDKDNICSWN